MNDFDLKSINGVFAKVASRGDKQTMLWQDTDGAWKPITSRQLYGRVRALADVLKGWGVAKGDRVVLLSENRWEWAVTDFATLALGAVDVPLYATNTPEHVGYMLRDSGAKVAVLSTKEQYDKLAGAGDLPDLQHVIVMDKGDFGNAESFAALMESASSKESPDADFDAAAAAIGSDDLATIIYTSGTTGEPKGVELTHGNLAVNVNVSTTEYGFNDKDSFISFLPLSHVTARHADYALMCHGARIAYVPKFNDIGAAMKAVKPTVFIGVPRVYEKIRQAVEGKSAHSFVQRTVLNWALGMGKAHRDDTSAGKAPSGLLWGTANKLVYSKIREAFGGCVHTFIAGGAPLGMESSNWFADAGIRVFEGYGLTETSPVIASNTPPAYRIGTVGKPVKNVEVRFAADGELEVKGPSVFHRYWKKEDATKEAMTEDGWFKTGDIGKLEDGFLSITDRKKELLKTSGGKLIAPQPIENKLKANTLVGQAALVGDGHKYACVLISPNFDALEKWAKAQGVNESDHGKLVADKKVQAEYERIMNGVNKELAPYETMKKVAVVPDEWSVEEGEMTPSMKLKRRIINEKYAEQIKGLFADEATSKKEG